MKEHDGIVLTRQSESRKQLQQIEEFNKAKKMELIMTKLVGNKKLLMMECLRTMGSMLFAHRKWFQGILHLQGIEMAKKKQHFEEIIVYGNLFNEWKILQRQKRIKLNYLAKWTNYYTNFSFSTLQKRTNKIKNVYTVKEKGEL